MNQLAFDIGAAIREEMRARTQPTLRCVDCDKPIGRRLVPVTMNSWEWEVQVDENGRCPQCAWAVGE